MRDAAKHVTAVHKGIIVLERLAITYCDSIVNMDLLVQAQENIPDVSQRLRFGRPVPTRFNSQVTAIMRLLQLHEPLCKVAAKNPTAPF